MRFIFTCMVIVGLSLFAIPLIPAFNAVQSEREAILASAASDVSLDVPPPVVAEINFPDTEMALDADAIANIEPAAGDTTGADPFVAPQDAFVGGFTNLPPSAFAEPQPVISETE